MASDATIIPGANVETSNSQPIREQSNTTTQSDIRAAANTRSSSADSTHLPQISHEDNTNQNDSFATESQIEAPMAAVDATMQKCDSGEENIETLSLQMDSQETNAILAEITAETDTRSISVDSTQTPLMTEERAAPMAATDATMLSKESSAETPDSRPIPEEKNKKHPEINAKTDTQSISADSQQTAETSPEEKVEDSARAPIESQTEDWRAQSKQILILSESGKPIYCRCVRWSFFFFHFCSFGLSLSDFYSNRERFPSTAVYASEMSF